MRSARERITSASRRLTAIGFGGGAGAAEGLAVLAARIVTQLCQFAVFVAGARLLSPEIFGVFALVSGIAVLLARLGEAGWCEFVIASRDAVAVDQAMTAAVLGGLGATTLCLGATLGAHALGANRDAVLLLFYFSLWLLPAAVSAAHSGMLVRRGRLMALSSVQIVGELAGLAVAVAALNGGSGVLSLVYGRLACQFLGVALLFALTRWSPPLRLDRSVRRGLFEFSAQILATRLIVFARSYAATLSVGSLLGAASAGYFRVAERLVLSFSEVLAETFLAVAWKTLRQAQTGATEPDAMRRRMAEEAAFLHPILLATAAPVFLGLALVAGPLIEVVLGAKWSPAAWVAAIVAVRQLLVMPSFLNEPLLAMAGEIRRMPSASGATALVSVVLIVLGAPFGITAVAIGQLAAGAFTLAVAIRLQSRFAAVSFRLVAVRSAGILPALAAMGVAVLLVGEAGRQAAWSAIALLLSQVLAGALFYGATLAAFQGIVGQGRQLFTRPVPA